MRGTTPPVAGGAGLPEGIEDRLAAADVFEAFAAARLLHEAIRTDGPTPERLGALVRAYAHLGILTDFLWTSTHKVYLARALLYSQRMVAQSPRSATALRHRAYARAFAGLHSGALDDLAAARAVATDSEPELEWVGLIDDFLHFRTEKFVEAGQGDQPRLARLLALLSAEASLAQTRRTVTLARSILEVDPECYRAHDLICTIGSLGDKHEQTLAGMEVLRRTFPDRLQALPGLPDRLAQMVRQGASAPDLARTLDVEGSEADTTEPTWCTLANLVRDIRFDLAWQRANFPRNALSTSAREFIAEARPLLVDHPYWPVIECFDVDPKRSRDRYLALHAGDEAAGPALRAAARDGRTSPWWRAMVLDLLRRAEPPETPKPAGGPAE